MAIPAELYICVPRRAHLGAMYTNIWANLTRKDTGEGISGKKIFSYLDNVNISMLVTGKAGFPGYPFDINPKTEGIHKTRVEFPGDAEFEPCKSEEITLKLDPNLTPTRIVMEVAPVSGDAPLTIRVTGTVYAEYSAIPEYSLPLDLMVYDRTITKTLRPVQMDMSNPDGTFAFDYTFTKPGTYRIFVNFLGDNKYASDWSNNGQTTQINVLEGGEQVSYLSVPIKVETDATMQYRIIGPSDTPPTPAEGYIIDPEPIEIEGVEGKFWIEFKIIAIP